LLRKRFEQRRTGQAAGWQEDFSRDWREALLAECDLRLAPLAGLVEAVINGSKNQQ
jgi:hypothetical protein